MVKPESGMPLSRRAIAIWTAVIAAVLTFCYWALVTRRGPGVFMVGYFPLVIAFLVLTWTGRLDRLGAAMLGATIAGLWPLYRWAALGDGKSATAYLVLVGFLGVFVLLDIGHEAAKRRGWMVESPERRRLLVAATFVYFILSVSGWPTGVWRTAALVTWVAVGLLLTFWPAAPRPSQQ